MRLARLGFVGVAYIRYVTYVVVMKCSSARLRGWSGHVQASGKERNVSSREINRMILLRALSLNSWKAIWQMILWPRSPQAQAGEAAPSGPGTMRGRQGGGTASGGSRHDPFMRVRSSQGREDSNPNRRRREPGRSERDRRAKGT